MLCLQYNLRNLFMAWTGAFNSYTKTMVIDDKKKTPNMCHCKSSMASWPILILRRHFKREDILIRNKCPQMNIFPNVIPQLLFQFYSQPSRETAHCRGEKSFICDLRTLSADITLPAKTRTSNTDLRLLWNFVLYTDHFLVQYSLLCVSLKEKIDSIASEG